MYIRTKSKIYETESAFLDNNGKWVGYNIVEDDMAIILRSQVIREADTLEELCDEFVFVNKVGNFDKSYVIHYNMPNHIFTEPTAKEKIAYIKKYYKDELDKIRGAIYTDKGLIYVAKIDNEGKLVLIWKRKEE